MVNMASDLVKNCKGLSGLGSCKCCCSVKLLAAKQSTDVTWGTLTCVVVCADVRNFWLFLIVFVLISCFKLKFLRKGIMSWKLLNISLKLLSIFNMCQCLFIIFFMFGSTELYVTKNGIESLRLGLRCFKSNDLSRWSTLSVCFPTVDSL